MNEEQRKAAQDALDWLNWFGCRSQNRPNKTRQLITDNLAKALQQHAPDDAPDWEGEAAHRAFTAGTILDGAQPETDDARDAAMLQEQKR